MEAALRPVGAWDKSRRIPGTILRHCEAFRARSSPVGAVGCGKHRDSLTCRRYAELSRRGGNLVPLPPFSLNDKSSQRRRSMKTFTLAAALAAGVLVAGPTFAQGTTNPGSSSGSTMSNPSTMSSNEHGSSAMNPHSLSQDQIKSAQGKLQQDGYYKEGKVDGTWGPETHQALQKFQQDHKLNANGELDQQTLAALGLQGGSWSTAGGSQSGTSGTS